jgi:hypothetical protein
MKLFLLKFFTWWSGQTFGTQLWTWRFGDWSARMSRATAIMLGPQIDRRSASSGAGCLQRPYRGEPKCQRQATVDVAPTEENYTRGNQHDRHARGLSALRLDAR